MEAAADLDGSPAIGAGCFDSGSLQFGLLPGDGDLTTDWARHINLPGDCCFASSGVKNDFPACRFLRRFYDGFLQNGSAGTDEVDVPADLEPARCPEGPAITN